MPEIFGETADGYHLSVGSPDGFCQLLDDTGAVIAIADVRNQGFGPLVEL